MGQASSDKQVQRKRGRSTSLDDDSQNDLDEINSTYVEDENQDTGVSTVEDGAEASQHALRQDGLPKNGSGWAELFVRDITSASTMDDAKARAFKLLEIAGNTQQENVMVKQQSEKLIRENAALKRAVNVDNYALAMHVRRATKNNSKYGRYYPGDLLGID
ncbi:hypothetical protein MKW92_002040 [Papaver armeniacum]|nr:hypothetical protein MKW92_002040 [Papaver armeniacum]